MNIYIDYTAVIELEKDIGKYTGAGNYTRDLIALLKEHGVAFQILIYKGFIPRKGWEKDLLEGSRLVRIGDITDFRFSKGDLLLLPAVTGRILVRVAQIRKRNRNLRIYAVIHDRQHNISRFDPMDRYFQEGIFRLVPLLYAKYRIKKLLYDLCYPLWIGSVDKVFTVSNYTLQALGHRNLKRISYFYQPTSVALSAPVKVPGYDEMGEYILFVSGGRPEKNLARALLAFRDFCREAEPDTRLCITGIDRSRLYYIARKLKLSPGFMDQYVRSYDYVDRGQLAFLYRNCRYLLFLSKGEGFGLPVLEAVQSGKTVLCSRQSAMPEVCGSILYYVDAFNLASIREGMIYLNDDRNLLYRERLAAKKKKIMDEQIALDKQVLVDEVIGL
ncbi:MAG: glycosyltransferase [Lachnospiraceae bacterium]|nr:glycosyltransferase [Lachnospiraceae bacterium]